MRIRSFAITILFVFLSVVLFACGGAVSNPPADGAIYHPPAADQCNAARAALQPAVPAAFSLQTVEFVDFEMKRGTACQLRAEGNGTNFANFFDTFQAIDAILVAQGWTPTNDADGPTGMGREYTLGSQVAAVFVEWKPSADADCPDDQPISACVLAPEQKIYTATITLAEK